MTAISRIVFVTASLLALGAFAHGGVEHLKGTVTRVEWVSPHGWVYVDVKGQDGKVVGWAVETAGPNALLRRGVRKTDFPIGVEVVVSGYRAKNGSKNVNGTSVTLPDGRNLYTGSSVNAGGAPE